MPHKYASWLNAYIWSNAFRCAFGQMRNLANAPYSAIVHCCLFSTDPMATTAKLEHTARCVTNVNSLMLRLKRTHLTLIVSLSSALAVCIDTW